MKKILVILMMLLVLLCGCSKVSFNKNKPKINMIGIYYLNYAKVNGETYPQEKLDKIKDKYIVIIKDNEHAEIYMNGPMQEVIYDFNFVTVKNESGKKEKIKYEFKDNSIIIYRNNNVYTFVRK